MRMYLTNIFKSLIALLFLSTPTMLCAKHFKVLDISDGLANNTVKCITQDALPDIIICDMMMTGMTVIEFINEYRIFKAVQFFKEGETNITAVSVKCGFNDLKNFRDLFKRKMQVSPKQFVSQL